jgi:hypothetical protein
MTRSNENEKLSQLQAFLLDYLSKVRKNSSQYLKKPFIPVLITTTYSTSTDAAVSASRDASRSQPIVMTQLHTGTVRDIYRHKIATTFPRRFVDGY